MLYRWRLHAGSEASFIAAWSRISAYLRDEKGSLGSRLHQGSDGIWYSYAQWPNAEARRAAFAEAFPSDQAESSDSAAMQAAVAEYLPEVVLDMVADFLLPLPTVSSESER